MQELVFAEERCENDKCLRDYGINMPFIKQVTSRSALTACDHRNISNGCHLWEQCPAGGSISHSVHGLVQSYSPLNVRIGIVALRAKRQTSSRWLKAL